MLPPIFLNIARAPAKAKNAAGVGEEGEANVWGPRSGTDSCVSEGLPVRCVLEAGREERCFLTGQKSHWRLTTDSAYFISNPSHVRQRHIIPLLWRPGAPSALTLVCRPLGVPQKLWQKHPLRAVG